MTGVMVAALSACGLTGQVQAAEQNAQEERTSYDTTADGIVQTTSGQVQGTNQNGIFRYLGVPYAQAPERFVLRRRLRGKACILWTATAQCRRRGRFRALEARATRRVRTIIVKI